MSSKVQNSKRRRHLFRLGAVAVGVGVLAMIELGLRLFGLGAPAHYEDEFVGFSAVYPLFVLNELDGLYEIPKSRQRFFAPESFVAQKPSTTRRIFCLGGSTVQGRPYSTETSFSTWLELSLNAADSTVDWEVINCGGISYASYRLIPILQECLNYDPDLIIICTGQNEFLEDRSYAHIKQAKDALTRAKVAASNLHLYQGLRAVWNQRIKGNPNPSKPNRPILPAEVDALLDYNDGLKAYHRDEPWRSGVIAHFRHNLERMIGLAEASGVPVILIRPPSNLRDCPPFKSEHNSDLTAEAQDQWEIIMSKARTAFRDDPQSAASFLKQAIEIDGDYAATYFSLGKVYEALAMPREAKAAYQKALELDICPLRILEPMVNAIFETARRAHVPVIDAHTLLEQDCQWNIMGNEALADHIHPTIDGHKKIAQVILQTLQDLGWIHPAAGWTSIRDRAYQHHFEALDQLYFLRGRRALDGLRAWSEGRADGLPIEVKLGTESP